MDFNRPPQLEQTPRQRLQTTQKLMLLPHMQQAFAILQMPIMELSELVLNEMEQNPLLDMNSIEFHDGEEAAEERVSDKLHELFLEDPSFTLLRNLDEEFSTHLTQTEDFGTRQHGNQEAQYQTFLESLIVGQEDPVALLMSQLREKIQNPVLLQSAQCLIGYLNEHGYLDTPLEEIAKLHEIPLAQLEEALAIVQQLEPSGIGARTLQECLSIQLKMAGKEGGPAWKMLKEEWENFIHRRIPLLAKTFHLTCEEIEKVIHDDVRPLQIHPYSQLRTSPAVQLVPDIILRYEEGVVTITINDESLPPLLIQPQYRKLIRECTRQSSPMHQFVRTHFSNLKWLTKMLHQRNQTLFRIAAYLAEKQQGFFTDQQTHIHPMTMQEVAQALELHESTIARAVANKYIDSPRGLMALRSFFTYGYSSSNGVMLSSSVILDAISACIRAEDKQHPLSDAKIALLLQKQGMTCARRTIAKHRTTLGIGNVQQRRHYHPPAEGSLMHAESEEQ